MDNSYGKYKKYKYKYKNLKSGFLDNKIPSIIYKSLLLSRYCYEPPVYFLIALGLSQNIFNNLPDKIMENTLADTGREINSILKDLDNQIKDNSVKTKNKLKKKYYDPEVIPKQLYTKINHQFAFVYITTNNDINCYILGDKLNKIVYVIFRGTQSISNIMTDLNMKQTNLCNLNKKDQLKVFQGFLSLEEKVINTIIFSCYYLSKDFIKNRVKLSITGHSLGAALASLFSYSYSNIIEKLHRLHDFLPLNLTCINFGGPKLFNKTLSYDFYKKIKNDKIEFYRCITRGDPISSLPKMFYYHPGFNILTGKYDPTNVYYFDCAGKKGGLDINYNTPMNIKHTISKKEYLYNLRNTHVSHVNYLYISFFGAIAHLHSFGQISSFNRNSVIKLIVYKNDNAESIEFTDNPFGNIPNYEDFKKYILKMLNSETLLDKKISQNMKNISLSYKELGNNKKIEPILRDNLNMNLNEIIDKFYNLNELIC